MAPSKKRPIIIEEDILENVEKSTNQIVLTFEEKETVEYILLVCRRKGINLPQYIIDNFEWDDKPACFWEEDKVNGKITKETCDGCEFIKECPDAVKKPRCIKNCIRCNQNPEGHCADDDEQAEDQRRDAVKGRS